MRNLLLIGILIAVVIVSGCTAVSTISKIGCEPDYIKSYSGNIFVKVTSDDCKRTCYDGYKVTSYKIEGNACYCDVNDCKG